jgi:hypothetical protein
MHGGDKMIGKILQGLMGLMVILVMLWMVAILLAGTAGAIMIIRASIKYLAGV